MHPYCGERTDGRLSSEHSACVRAGLRYPGGRMVTDHIVPKTQGGTDDASNLQTLCERCHNVKTTTIDGGGWQREVGLGR